MVTNPNSVLDVFTSLDDLAEGSQLVVHQLSGQATGKDVELTRYIAGMLSLAKRLLGKPKSLAGLKDCLNDIHRRLEHFELTSPTIIQGFAEGYSKVISPIGQKIQVIGNPNVLKQENVQNQVRALLLAGVRAGVLWRQYGGQRRQFVFSRQKILQEAVLFNKELSAIS
jgi:high frequency lysogenization protein